ncbi:MAG: YkgJ family cysteine cluster protein [Chloroflexaceae bacterium]|nr:YkgJ family cysteine cluster protein [Chloroflexaceae bacterium]
MSFYQNGLRFECTRCSRCCARAGFRVPVGLGPPRPRTSDQFAGGRVRAGVLCSCPQQNGLRLSLKEKPNFDCIFWEPGGCRVYEARPLQCRSYPFWSDHLRTEAAWSELEESCPGVNHGTLHPRETIDDWLRRRKLEPLLVFKREDS